MTIYGCESCARLDAKCHQRSAETTRIAGMLDKCGAERDAARREVARLTGLLELENKARRCGFYAGFAYRSNGGIDHVHGADVYLGQREGLAPKEAKHD